MRQQDIKPNPIVEELINEVNMSPATLTKWASSPAAEGMLVGIEYELVATNFTSADEAEYDMDYDERFDSLEEIAMFFYSHSVDFPDEVREAIDEGYWEHYSEKFDEYVENHSADGKAIMLEYYVENYMPDDYWQQAYDKAEEQLTKEYREAGLPAASLSEETIEKRQMELATPFITKELKADENLLMRAQEKARETLDIIFHNSDDYPSFMDYMESRDLTLMSDILHEYEHLGLGWPYLTSNFSAELEELGMDLAGVVGMNVETSANYHDIERTNDKWIIEVDESIQPEYFDSGEAGIEIISPPLPIDQAITALNDVVQWASYNSMYTNSTTGLHINVSMPGVNANEIDFVKLALIMGDKYILQKFDRLSSTFASSAIDKIQASLSTKEPAEMAVFMDQFRTDLNGETSQLIFHRYTQKYTSINLAGEYIEFRGPGNDWLGKDVEQLVLTIYRLAMSMTIASDPNAHKQEYAKKLFKLLSAGKSPEDNDAVEMFTRFVAGKLPKEQLSAWLRERQRTRVFKQRAAAGEGPFKFVVRGYTRSEKGEKLEPPLNMEMVTANSEEEAKEKWLDMNSQWKNYKNNIIFDIEVM
jgi:hypothetical protein